MNLRTSLLVRGAIADDCLARDERRPRIGGRLGQGTANVVKIMPIAVDHMPAGGAVARGNILARRQVHRTVYGNTVIVPQHIQVPKLQMPGQTDCFMVDSFHEATIACDHPSLMINQLIAKNRVQMPFGNRHADRHRHALPQRSGCSLDTFKLEIFRVPSTWASQLAEISNIIHCRPRIAGQVERRISEHRAMTGRKHETVTIGPFRISWVKFQKIGI